MKKILIAALSFITLSSFSEDKKVKLVIDAAHSGKPAAAIAETGDSENEICIQFATALYVQAQLKGIDVVMTRSADEYRSMMQNTVADPNNKTYFVSFYTASEKTKQMRGAEVIYTSENESGKRSKAFAEKVLAAFNRLNNTPSVITDKDIAILKESKVPAVMVSMGYISNNQDLSKLKDAGTQKELAMMLVDAIKE